MALALQPIEWTALGVEHIGRTALIEWPKRTSIGVIAGIGSNDLGISVFLSHGAEATWRREGEGRPRISLAPVAAAPTVSSHSGPAARSAVAAAPEAPKKSPWIIAGEPQ